MTLNDLQNLIADKDVYEVYIDTHYFVRFKQLAIILQHSYDERGEFFWLMTKKIRPLPLMKAGVVIQGGTDTDPFIFSYLAI